MLSIARTAAELASGAVVCVDPQLPVSEALVLMSSRRISCLVAVLRRHAVGILTERDLVLAANVVLGYPELQVREVMSSPVLTVEEGKPVREVCRLMLRNQVRHLPVTDADLQVTGILTQTDLLDKLPLSAFRGAPDLSSLMSAPVITVDPEQSVRHALAEMARHRISCLVIAEGDYPLGLFSERNVAQLFAGDARSWSAPVSAVMSPATLSVAPGTTPAEAVGMLRSQGVRRLLVTAASGQLLGLVTQSDLARALFRSP